jgi:murein DD-endopeptidase MepM/ murein hydrolase activator NlpD
MSRAHKPGFLLISLILLAAACTPVEVSVDQFTPQPLLKSSTPAERTPNIAIQQSQAVEKRQVTLTPSATRLLATDNAILTLTSGPSTSPLQPSSGSSTASCIEDICSYASPFSLKRPIAEPGNIVVDYTYRFGSTQGGKREPHHGVELLNSSGTPVLAAADGVVVVAGDDLDPTSQHGEWPITFYGPYSYFYGNLVVIEHQPKVDLLIDAPDVPTPIYTLYAHLSEIIVEQGEQVTEGQQIGAVGLSGIAEGSHLHFEVRLGDNNYKSVSNPELWLAARHDEGGQRMGGIAGRVLDGQGNEVVVNEGIVLQRLPEGQDGPKDLEFYTQSYEEPLLIGQPPWRESFAIGDLPSGLYRITFAYQGVQQFLVQVQPGQLSVVTLRVD